MYALAAQANQTATVALSQIEKHEAVCAERSKHAAATAEENKRRLTGIEEKVEHLPDSLEKKIAASPHIAELKAQNVLIIRVMVWGGIAAAGVTGTLLWYFASSFMDSIRTALQAAGKPVP